MKRFPILYNLSDLRKQEKKALKILHNFTNSVIESKRKELAGKFKSAGGGSDEKENEMGIKKKTALLDLLLQSTINGEPLSNEAIREEVDTFTFEVTFLMLFPTKFLIKLFLFDYLSLRVTTQQQGKRFFVVVSKMSFNNLSFEVVSLLYFTTWRSIQKCSRKCSKKCSLCSVMT